MSEETTPPPPEEKPIPPPPEEKPTPPPPEEKPIPHGCGACGRTFIGERPECHPSAQIISGLGPWPCEMHGGEVHENGRPCPQL